MTSESERDLLLVLTLECKTLGMVVARYRTLIFRLNMELDLQSLFGLHVT